MPEREDRSRGRHGHVSGLDVLLRLPCRKLCNGIFYSLTRGLKTSQLPCIIYFRSSSRLLLLLPLRSGCKSRLNRVEVG